MTLHRALTPLLAIGLFVAARIVDASGTWTPIANYPPGSPGLMLLLTDGSIMVQSNSSNGWYRLTPGSHGSYISGTWSTLESMHDSRLYFSAQVLKDGRVFVAGAEYGTGGSSSEVYEPKTNTWTYTSNAGQNFVDSVSATLPNGNVIVGPARGASSVTYDIAANSWSSSIPTLNGLDEVPWVKLPDGTILCADSNGNAERYIPTLNKWVADGTVPVSLYSGSETGSGHLLANGKVFFRGYSHTALYTPSGNNSPGSWTAGPDIPGGNNCGDSPGAVMANGRILFVAARSYLGGITSFYEYDPVANTIAQINGPTGLTDGNLAYAMLMLALPDGGTLFNEGYQLYEYMPSGAPLAAGQPAISAIDHNADGSYRLTGTLLNGISEGASYGDDAQMNSNYPVVRMTDSASNIYYCKTYNWSSTGVMTGSTPETTAFTIPPGLPAGAYSVVVTANGNASAPVSLTIPTDPADSAPTVATPAAASTGSTTGTLSVLGADSDGGGESNLTYTWVTTGAPFGSTPHFSVNSSNAAKNTTVTFHSAGAYAFKVVITDASGLSISSSVSATVDQILSSISISPTAASLTPSQTQQFYAYGYDQFGSQISNPPAATWAVTSGGGTVSQAGLYTAPASGGLAVVTVASGTYRAAATIGVLSPPWVSADIGYPALAGTAYDTNGVFTLLGAGNDIWDAADAFHFVYRRLDGDGTLFARVASQQNSDGWAKGGVMIRETLDAGSTHATMAITPGNGATFQTRLTTGAASNETNTGGVAAPYWVKIVRAGNNLTGYRSADGVNWTSAGSATITMAQSAFIGLEDCSHNTGVINTTTFDRISLTSALNDTLAVAPGAAATVNVVANDTSPAGTKLTVTSVTQGAKGAVVSNGDGTLTYTASNTASGSDAFQYTVSDGIGGTASAIVNVSISGLQAYYKFDEGKGTTSADATGDGFLATLLGAGWTTGIEGTGGLLLSGNGQSYASIPALNLNANTVTITAWVKRSGIQSASTGLILCRTERGASGLNLGPSNDLRYLWNSSAASANWSSGLTLPDGQWIFVALVVTPTDATIYMQPLGAAMQSSTNPVVNTVAAFNAITQIGNDSSPGGLSGGIRNFNGTMDEVRIYNESLDVITIAGLANPAPTVAIAAAATPSPVVSLTAAFTVLGASNIYAESGLTYTWAATNVPAGAAAPAFSINGTNAAKNTTATFNKSGAYTFMVTIKDAGGGSVPGILNVTVTLPPFDNWLVLNFGSNAANAAISGPGADPDADGMSNLLEYALNTNPARSSRDLQPAVGIEGPNATLTYRQNDAATDLTYSIEQSLDLSAWTVAPATLSTLSDDGITSVVKASVPVPAVGPSGLVQYLMLRLRVTLH